MAKPPSFTEWAPFLAMTADRPASEWLVKALDYANVEDGDGRLAIDLGCGGGADTRALLDRHWAVLAVDLTPEARDLLLERVDAGQRPRLDIAIGGFDEVEFPAADLVFAQMSLPFAYDTFESSVGAALAAVAPGGVFAGHLFGERDEWVVDGPAIGVTREWAEGLFAGWSDVVIEETDADGEFVGGQNKHWHYYFICARR